MLWAAAWSVMIGRPSAASPRPRPGTTTAFPAWCWASSRARRSRCGRKVETRHDPHAKAPVAADVLEGRRRRHRPAAPGRDGAGDGLAGRRDPAGALAAGLRLRAQRHGDGQLDAGDAGPGLRLHADPPPAGTAARTHPGPERPDGP